MKFGMSSRNTLQLQKCTTIAGTTAVALKYVKELRFPTCGCRVPPGGRAQKVNGAAPIATASVLFSGIFIVVSEMCCNSIYFSDYL